MKKLILFLFVATCAFACSSEKDDPDAPFENLNDLTTTALETTIPRLELSQFGDAITIMLSVTDQEGSPLEQFTLGNYKVEVSVNGGALELISNNELELSNFNDLNNKPLAAATTMDYSGSMSSYDISEMEKALADFINLKDDNDLMSIIKFASYIEEVQAFTTDKSLLLAGIDADPYIGSATAFYSACELGLDEVNKLSDVLPVVIGFTDGIDNRSNINLYDLAEKSKALSIPIYTVGFGNTDKEGLEYLASETGGRYFYSPTSDDITHLYQLISQQLRNLYVLNWITNYTSGTQITIQVTTTYKGGNDSFTDVSTKTITIE
ncbi:hypothetical protein PK35_03625 [Tamlana nanhaiensis]|uniref:VWFA domain-containing protein n=1 Tax=Neotamlana nanhaiensis TaxID=1382798 RepID=A0A0D7W433_9FLAO|nr:VWA domain-containing protein [Tamlana nanhaiensis]KJD33846.1 hypothetical protein PK35_03625 [Tamlana nanhaiensis]